MWDEISKRKIIRQKSFNILSWNMKNKNLEREYKRQMPLLICTQNLSSEQINSILTRKEIKKKSFYQLIIKLLQFLEAYSSNINSYISLIFYIALNINCISKRHYHSFRSKQHLVIQNKYNICTTPLISFFSITQNLDIKSSNWIARFGYVPVHESCLHSCTSFQLHDMLLQSPVLFNIPNTMNIMLLKSHSTHIQIYV